MAEQILYGVAEELITKIGSSAFQEFQLVYRFKNHLKEFQDSLSIIKGVILDADEVKQKKSHAVEAWIRRVQDIVDDAEDLIDDLAYEDLRRNINKGYTVQDFFSSSNQVWFHLKMGHRIKNLTKRLNEVKNDISLLNLVSKERVGCRQNMISQRETDSYVQSLEIIGREEDQKKIIDSLLCESSQGNHNNVSLVAIVGFGGLGKTALAQLVYNDDEVDKHFEKKMWVCVSEEFEVKVLMKKILKCLSRDKVDDLEMEQLQTMLRENLGGQRYLLVLDDVWNDGWQKWDSLKKYLWVGDSGSMILVTTRSKKVASVMGVESPYHLQGLKENQAWDLFRKLSFGEGYIEVNPKIVKIGEEIAKKCKGVPLVIRTLGSLMHLKSEENEWLSVLKNDLWSSLESSGDIVPVLKLSYDHLPTHLKQCFAYCAMFPKDYEFDKEVLIRLWMAQGYIVGSSSNECLEDIGQRYFKELLFRCFFQLSEIKFGYKMHDLIHDLAQSIAKDSCIVVEKKNLEKISERAQHVNWQCSQYQLKKLVKVKGMRTLYFDEYDYGGRNLNMITSNCQRLHALHLPRPFIRDDVLRDEVPRSIGKLNHLRYLDISKSRVKTLPDSITNLHNLRTLILSRCNLLRELPRDMQNLIRLRCLMIDRCVSLKCMPMGLGKLTCLRRLSDFKVCRISKIRKGASINELEHLSQLRGGLHIWGLGDVTSDELESIKVKLLNNKPLQYLRLSWSSYESRKPILYLRKITRLTVEESQVLLENLEPHPDLQELYASHYKGVRFSNWLSYLTNLVKLTLGDCENLKQIPRLYQLPSLKTLYLWDLYALEYISDESEEMMEESSFQALASAAFFPSLQKIDITNCPNLKQMWRSRRMSQVDLSQFPCLAKLEIRRCQNLASLPKAIHQLTSLQELKIVNCPKLSERYERENGVDWPKISHIPRIDII